jgi:hypothetical protein
MKKMVTAKPTKERPQKAGASGVNTPVKKEKVPQVEVKTTYGRPTQTQKL